MDVQTYINNLALNPHPEGGFYKEIFRADFEVNNSEQQKRSALTSIYYLLQEGDFSALHRIKSDEIWYFHAGNSLELVAIDPKGTLHKSILGNNPAAGEQAQVVMPAGWIFGAKCKNGFCFCGCAVAPGFQFEDFEMIARADLLQMHPQHQELILEFTRG